MSGDNTNNQLTTLLTTNANLLNNILNNIEPSIQSSLATNNSLITNIVDNLLPLTNTCITLGQTTEVAAMAATASQQNSQQASLAVQAVEALNLPVQVTTLSSSVSNLQSEVDTISSKINNQSSINNTVENLISQVDDLTTQVTNVDSIVNPTTQSLDFNNIENLKLVKKHTFVDQNYNEISTSAFLGPNLPFVSSNMDDPNRTKDLAYFVFANSIWAFDLNNNIFVWNTTWAKIIAQDALLNNNTGGPLTKVYAAQKQFVQNNNLPSYLMWQPPSLLRYSPIFSTTQQGGRIFLTTSEFITFYGGQFLIELDSNTGDLVTTVQIPLKDIGYTGRIVPTLGIGINPVTSFINSVTEVIKNDQTNELQLILNGSTVIQYAIGELGLTIPLLAQHEIHNNATSGFLACLTRYSDGSYPSFPTSNFSQAVDGFWETQTGTTPLKGFGTLITTTGNINNDIDTDGTPKNLTYKNRTAWDSGIYNVGDAGIFGPVKTQLYTPDTADKLTTAHFTRKLDANGNLTTNLNPIEMFVPVDYGYQLVNLSNVDSATDAYHGDYQYLVAWNAFNLVDQFNKSYSVPVSCYLPSLHMITVWNHYLNKWYTLSPDYNTTTFTQKPGIFWIEKEGWGPTMIGKAPSWLSVNNNGNYGYSMFLGNTIIMKDQSPDGAHVLTNTYTIYTIDLATHLATKVGSGLTFKSISRIFVDCKFMQSNGNDPVVALGRDIPLTLTAGTNTLPSTTPGFTGSPSNANDVNGSISSQLLIGQFVRKWLSPSLGLSGTYALDSMEADRLNCFGGSCWIPQITVTDDNKVIAPVGNGYSLPYHIYLNINNVQSRQSPTNWFTYADYVSGTVGFGSKWGSLDLTPRNYPTSSLYDPTFVLNENRELYSNIKRTDYYISTSNTTALQNQLKYIEANQKYICENMHKLLSPFSLRGMFSTHMVVDLKTGNLVGRCATPYCSDAGFNSETIYLAKYGNFSLYSDPPPWKFNYKFVNDLVARCELNSYPTGYDNDASGPLFKYNSNTYYGFFKAGCVARYDLSHALTLNTDSDYQNVNFNVYQTYFLLGTSFSGANNIGDNNYSYGFSNKNPFTGAGKNAILAYCKNFSEIAPNFYYMDVNNNMVSYPRGTSLMEIIDVDSIESYIAANNTAPLRNQFFTYYPITQKIAHLSFGGAYSFIDSNGDSIGVVFQEDGKGMLYNFNTQEIKRVDFNTPSGRSNFSAFKSSLFIIEENALWGITFNNAGLLYQNLPYAVNQYQIVPEKSLVSTEKIVNQITSVTASNNLHVV